jgi:glyoxylase-like metal-dependent hydrolase (beta-lactamase superfamily II)
MKEIAPDLFLLRGFPPNAINVYLMGDVLLDAGTRHAARRILKQLRGRKVSAHALTHAHPDHQGSSKAVSEALGIPVWCGEKDVPALESGDLSSQVPDPSRWLIRLENLLMTGPGCPVARALKEGDEVGGFTVLETPGHSPGHLAYWRERDGVLIAGDTALNMNAWTGLPGLYEPLRVRTPDPAQNRASLRRLASLGAKIICFGHGAPLRDNDKFRRFVDALKD